MGRRPNSVASHCRKAILGPAALAGISLGFKATRASAPTIPVCQETPDCCERALTSGSANLWLITVWLGPKLLSYIA